nr:MAG TPA: helix-turn-helix domain protein [Caudoviricetes sp.]
MLAERIKELRLLRNMSQAELGKKLGVSAKQVSYYACREDKRTPLAT